MSNASGGGTAVNGGTNQAWPSHVNAHVGAHVRARRRQLGMSLEELGQGLGVGYQQVQKYETGENRISADRLPDLSYLLRVPIEYFFEGLRQPGRAEPQPEPDSLAVELAEAWGRIADPEMRGHLLALAKGLGRAEA
jgi:transcriptional regulator with XRE-family HTH domain